MIRRSTGGTATFLIESLSVSVETLLKDAMPEGIDPSDEPAIRENRDLSSFLLLGDGLVDPNVGQLAVDPELRDAILIEALNENVLAATGYPLGPGHDPAVSEGLDG